jgi:hypothetical protein
MTAITRFLMSVAMIALVAGPALGQAARPGTAPPPTRTPPALVGPPTGLPRVSPPTPAPPTESGSEVPATTPGTTAPPPARTPPAVIGPPTGLPGAPPPNEPRSGLPATPDSIVGGFFMTGQPSTGLLIDPATGALVDPRTLSSSTAPSGR